MTKARKGLGRGLDRIIPLVKDLSPHEIPKAVLQDILTGDIYPNPYQPRTTFDSDKIEALSQTIKSSGIVQPVVVRNREEGGYELIAGERRWRAAQLAELTEVPALIRSISDQEALAMALLENIQREDLNPMDEARALARLIQEFELTHAEAAECVGRSRAAVSNLLRMLELHPDVQAMVIDGELEMGHARALLPLDSEAQLTLAQQVAQSRLSVRQAESLVRSTINPVSAPTISQAPQRAPPPTLPVQWKDRIAVTQTKENGTELRITHLSDNELTDLLRWLANRDT